MSSSSDSESIKTSIVQPKKRGPKKKFSRKGIAGRKPKNNISVDSIERFEVSSEYLFNHLFLV